MNSFYSNRQSGFVLKYRNCNLPSWKRLQWLKNNFKMGNMCEVPNEREVEYPLSAEF
jgi:hypothetical protein